MDEEVKRGDKTEKREDHLIPGKLLFEAGTKGKEEKDLGEKQGQDKVQVGRPNDMLTPYGNPNIEKINYSRSYPKDGKGNGTETGERGENTVSCGPRGSSRRAHFWPLSPLT